MEFTKNYKAVLIYKKIVSLQTHRHYTICTHSKINCFNMNRNRNNISLGTITYSDQQVLAHPFHREDFSHCPAQRITTLTDNFFKYSINFIGTKFSRKIYFWLSGYRAMLLKLSSSGGFTSVCLLFKHNYLDRTKIKKSFKVQRNACASIMQCVGWLTELNDVAHWSVA